MYKLPVISTRGVMYGRMTVINTAAQYIEKMASHISFILSKYKKQY